jgi:hypothetical protein
MAAAGLAVGPHLRSLQGVELPVCGVHCIQYTVALHQCRANGLSIKRTNLGLRANCSGRRFADMTSKPAGAFDSVIEDSDLIIGGDTVIRL